MPHILNPADVQPFSTTNAILAYSLYIAGVPFIDPAQPCFNQYTADILFKIGGGEKDPEGKVVEPSRFSGMDIEDAARMAFERQMKGHVEYLFRMTAQLSGLLRAHEEQQKELKEGNGTPSELQLRLVKSFVAGEMSEQEYLVRSTYVGLKCNVEFKNLWKKFSPMIKIDNPGKTRTEKTMVRNKNGEMVQATQIVSPGFKLYSLNLSAEKRKKIGLKV